MNSSSPMQKSGFPRKPTERLAGCVWLPRFVDKVRKHACGQLTGDYQLAFCHPLGLDGHFLRHFGLDTELALAAILSSADDSVVAAWFLSQPGVTDTRINEWNEFAPLFGRTGNPGERAFKLMLSRMTKNIPNAPRLHSAFEAILWDEGSEQQ